MGTWRPRRTAARDSGARETLDRAVAVLRDCQRGGTAAVPVDDVLELLGAEPAPAPQVPARDPLADPLTGCRSVLPRQP